MKRIGRTWRAMALALAMPIAANAQETSAVVDLDRMRAYLVDAFERNRAMDLAYLEAAPDSMLRWAPTAGVRDFASQMAHTTHNFFAPWRSTAPVADTAGYLNDKAALAERLGEGYDWALSRLRTMDDATLLTEQQILGQPAPLWRVMQYWLDHAMWTRASVIPYLRLNGVEPPQVTFW